VGPSTLAATPTVDPWASKEDQITDNYRGRIVERNGAVGFFFLLAYIGAAIYFISVSDGSFWAVVLGLLQAMVWPVYVVYQVLVVLGA